MNPYELSFIFFVGLGSIGYLVGVYIHRNDEKRGREMKIMSDADYNEQQKIHQGDS